MKIKVLVTQGADTNAFSVDAEVIGSTPTGQYGVFAIYKRSGAICFAQGWGEKTIWEEQVSFSPSWMPAIKDALLKLCP